MLPMMAVQLVSYSLQLCTTLFGVLLQFHSSKLCLNSDDAEASFAHVILPVFGDCMALRFSLSVFATF